MTATFPEALHPTAPVPGSEKPAVHRREHLLDVGRIHTVFDTDARIRDEACGPLAPLPPPSTALARTARCTESLRRHLPRQRPSFKDGRRIRQGAQATRP
ncbi:hypothetical protein ACFU7Y_10375 [Kitasatospora sp. NPDC057542]|uniref:hypothetical protein n=1 Tax=Streptomycetaceae TaxID=2062 RepID=UPI001CC9CA17|nr:hypothetical protein [Streptomyces sp. LS1784]